MYKHRPMSKTPDSYNFSFFTDVDEKQQAWMVSVAKERQHDMVEFHCSVLYESHKMSYDYLKSMVNSAIQWSQRTSKADSKQAERRRRYCSRSVGLR